MTVEVIEQKTTYTVDHLEGFQTTDKQHAKAVDMVYHPSVVQAMRDRLKETGRYTTDSRLEGSLARQQEDSVWLLTKHFKATPLDHFGMDNQCNAIALSTGAQERPPMALLTVGESK